MAVPRRRAEDAGDARARERPSAVARAGRQLGRLHRPALLDGRAGRREVTRPELSTGARNYDASRRARLAPAGTRHPSRATSMLEELRLALGAHRRRARVRSPVAQLGLAAVAQPGGD